MIDEFQKQEFVIQDTLKAAQTTLKEAEKSFQELEDQNKVLQEDREYLRTENTKIKKQMKQIRENSNEKTNEKKENDAANQTCTSIHSTNESECCCCATTVRGLSKLQKIVHDEFVAHSGRKETTSTPRSSASDVSERDDARDQVNDNAEQSRNDRSQNEQLDSPPPPTQTWEFFLCRNYRAWIKGSDHI